MILDLHNHSIKSDDGRAKVENYCKWIRSKDIPIDGFALTEHRQFDPTDYSALAKKYGLVILEGSEVETEYGHDSRLRGYGGSEEGVRFYSHQQSPVGRFSSSEKARRDCGTLPPG